MIEIKLTKPILKLLRPALAGAVGTVKTEILKGESKLFLSDSKELFIVLREEVDQLVVVAVAGRHLIKAQQEIIDYARKNGFLSIRYHTKFPRRLIAGLRGLNKKLIEIRQHVFGKTEFVYIINL